MSKNCRYVIFAIVTLLGALICFFNAWSDPVKDRTVFYYAQPVTFLLALLIIPSIICVILIRVRRLVGDTASPKTLLPLGISVFILFGANAITCAGIPPLLFVSYTPLQNTYLVNHLYRLDFMFSPGVGGDHTSLLVLWECDSEGWFCSILYAQEFYQNMTPKLESDTNNSLRLLVNNTVVFTHVPSS